MDKFCIQYGKKLDTLLYINYENYIGSNYAIFYAGMWVLHKNILGSVKEGVMNIWKQEMLNKNRMDTEEIALALFFKENFDLVYPIFDPNHGKMFYKFFSPI